MYVCRLSFAIKTFRLVILRRNALRLGNGRRSCSLGNSIGKVDGIPCDIAVHPNRYYLVCPVGLRYSKSDGLLLVLCDRGGYVLRIVLAKVGSNRSEFFVHLSYLSLSVPCPPGSTSTLQRAIETT